MRLLPPRETTCYEQLPLSHALLSHGLYRPIDTRFNSTFYETAAVYYPYVLMPENPSYEMLLRTTVRIQFQNNFFLHFAHVAQWMRFLVE